MKTNVTDKPQVTMDIKPGKPTPAQQAAWDELWGKLLAQGQNRDNGTELEA